MAHAFKTISAKPTFGTLRQNLYQSDYINRKKGIITYCKYASYCQKIKNDPSYDRINSYNIGRYALTLDKCNVIPVNKSNLIIGQYSKSDLTDVCTVSNIFPYSPPNPNDETCPNTTPVIIDQVAATPFYYDHIIDPLGQLFGKSQCGELNYTQYTVFNPPPSPLTLGTS